MMACKILAADLEINKKWRPEASIWHQTEALFKDGVVSDW